MNRILEIDLANERAVVQPGVVNLDITLAVQAQKYFYAPDPSSQRACTIGGCCPMAPFSPSAAKSWTCRATI